jgi:imidazole glycerol-phosphate synthase subunit HisF
MLTKRIIPCLDVKLGRVVKGVHFIGLQDVGDPVTIAKRYEAEGADELVFLDITATHEGRDIMVDIVRRVAEVIFMPYTVGGGIRTLADATMLIQAGAEKISLNSAAVKTPDLICEVSKKFGSCATVVNIDPKRVKNAAGEEVWEVFVNGGRVATGLEAIAWAKEVEQRGAGEIVLTSMDADGTKQGFDLPILKAVSEAVRIPVVASGGAGSPEHFRQAFEAGADAALAASIFHYEETSIAATKRYLASHGIAVRQFSPLQ